MVYIVILNWNGYKDTIECLKSIEDSFYKETKIIIVDNNSFDDSLNQIESFSKKSNLDIHVIANDENSGFSKGCNIGIDYALSNSDCNYVWLLNNDTEIEKNTIFEMVSFLNKNPDYQVITPQINYYDSKELIWNCGGTISKLGFRKYYYPKKNQNILPNELFLDVSFLTNCASFFRSDFFMTGYRLDERFFFGEEDFSLGLYCLKNKIKMACILTSKIYHKVSSSIQKQTDKSEDKYFIHYMNRLIDMKTYYENDFIFRPYLYLYFLYIRKLLANKITDFKQFKKDMLISVYKYEDVSKDIFEKVMKDGYHTFVTEGL